MSRKSASERSSRLARQLTRLEARQRRQLRNEDIVRLEKNGELSYERVRTVGSDSYASQASEEADHTQRLTPAPSPAQFAGGDAQNPENSNLLPNKLPETPVNQEIGNLSGGSAATSEPAADSPTAAEALAAEGVAATAAPGEAAANPAGEARISCHEAENSGNAPSDADADGRDPLAELLDRAIAAAQVRRGRPRAFDEHAKGQLAALLSVGMSMRQAASLLGVSHTTIQNTLKADPALTDEITAARFQAQLHPLACIIREARRSWKAATWLLKYLDQKLATHEETPDERRQRGIRETEEFFARPTRGSTRQRK